MNQFAVILAGGRSRRMGGRAKACIALGGMRLIERVVARLEPQSPCLLISGPEDFGTGLPHITDLPDAPPGPAAAIWTVWQWLLAHEPGTSGFFTVPVDGPFLPADLTARLGRGGNSAIASDGTSDHPTFAYWALDDLSDGWPRFEHRGDRSLRALADACSACRVVWADPDAFFNVNTPEDVQEAERRLGCGQALPVRGRPCRSDREID